jgi:hypothetical protein
MALRGLALVVVLLAGLVIAWRAPGLLLQVFVVASFSLLGVFIALLAVQRGRPDALERLTPVITDGIRKVRQRVSVARPRPAPAVDSRRGQVDVVPWDDDEPAPPVATADGHTTARQLTDRLAPRIPEMADELGPYSPQEVMLELQREGEDLRALGRLLRLDLSAYGNRIARALAGARAGRFDECALALQVANERLRTEVQGALEKELPRVRSNPAFRR